MIGRPKTADPEKGPSVAASNRSPVRDEGGDSTPLIMRLCAGRTSGPVTVFGWALFALGLILLGGQFWGGINPQDEGEMIVYPWLIARGWAPYTHIWTMYPPASFLLLAGLAKIGLPGTGGRARRRLHRPPGVRPPPQSCRHRFLASLLVGGAAADL